MPPTLKPDQVIHNRFIIVKEIGKGGFGNVYVAIDQATGAKVALKIAEPAPHHTGIVRGALFGNLEMEYKVLVHINGGTSTGGFPRVYFFGKYEENPFIIMELLGPSLKTLAGPNSSVPLKTILFLMDQSIWHLEVLHSKGIIHRDLKPDNIVIGRENRDKVYLIDFGLATIYRTAEKHLSQKDVDLVLGTPAFMPISGHLKKRQGRRDDLESLAYVVLSLLTHGKLPWRDIDAANVVQREAKITETKMTTTPEQLFSGFPQEFAVFLNAVRKLKFDEKPQYTAYRRMFRLLGYCLDVNYEGAQDW